MKQLLITSFACLFLAGADCTVELNRWTPTQPLHIAAKGDDTYEIRRALSNGYFIDRTDESGNTALHIAASYGRVNAVRYLLERGANVNAREALGRTPLHIAAVQTNLAYRDYLETMGLLLRHGACLDAKDNYGDTPLHRAVEWRVLPSVEFLVRKGAARYIPNHANKTPVRLAEERLAEEQARLFEIEHDYTLCCSQKESLRRTALESIEKSRFIKDALLRF